MLSSHVRVYASDTLTVLQLLWGAFDLLSAALAEVTAWGIHSAKSAGTDL